MAVHVVINVHNMDLSDRLQDYVEKKVSKLDRYLDVLEEAKVDLTYAKTARNASDRNVAQLTVRGKGVLMRAEERTDDMFASVDTVLDKIHRQIERFKGRCWRPRGDGRPLSSVVAEPEPIEANEESPLDLIVRRKRFQLAPMGELEAIEQMSLIGHENFFVFLNGDTNEVNVLYRRRDGSLGLIETEMA